MESTTSVLVVYLIFFANRVAGCFRRGREPMFRGPGWFFDIPVAADFYCREFGVRILAGYRMRMLLPFAVEIPAAAYLLLSRNIEALPWLIVFIAAWVHVNHHYSRAYAQRRALRVSGKESTVTPIIAATLRPRDARDFSNQPAEATFAIVTIAALGYLVWLYRSNPSSHDPRSVFGVPALYLYIQLGLVLLKRYIAGWGAPLCASQAVEHLILRERTRRFYLRLFDFVRAFLTIPILLWPAIISRTNADAAVLWQVWQWTTVALTIGLALWIEVERKAIASAERVAPVERLADPLQQSTIAPWPVCLQPSAPMLILRGARGNSLNIAHGYALIAVAYFLGMSALLLTVRS